MKINNFYPITPEVSRKLRQGKLTAAECTPEKKEVICSTLLSFDVIATFEEVEV